ncbi:hypothetical protein N7449_003823 [Penicillium cf. viridicatum]|uniref:LysM domain-containing protein n=1 Tax=Penicillium cf. viridicatum TaxID=2972119 RepID=A0A9W9MXN0_9EURO|nr:hypothetical protein N7449_003823 [Penicillium cf. viridicatum]
MDEGGLALLCVDDCRAELESLRSTISTSCTGTEDAMTYQDVAYPATFMVDNLLNTYDVSCYKDASSGTYCDLILAEWRNETNTTDTAHDCDDCTLGPFKLQLESVIGYDDDWAEDFASLTSSCGATGYTWTSPSAYSLSTVARTTTAANATSTSTSATQTCVSTYTVQTNDTCNSIAASQNVSTYNLMTANSLTILCSNLPEVGEILCIPATCNTVSVLNSDSCDDYMDDWGVSMAKVLSWNPIIDDTCDNLYLFIDWVLCSGPTSDWSPATTSATTTAPATATAMPTNGISTSNQNCASWYTVQSGDECATISVTAGITLDEFLFLNPEVDTNCTNLWVDYAYCVEAVGDIATYSGWTTITTTTIFTKPTTTATTYTPGPTYSQAFAPGTDTDCDVYLDGVDSTNNPLQNSGISTSDWDSLGYNFNNCSVYESLYEVNVTQLVSWNPSLTTSNCTLQMGYSYCVLKSWDLMTTTAATDSGVSSCLSVNSTWIMPDTVSDCNCYTVIYGKESDGVDCTSLCGGDDDDDYSITEATLVNYNPWIGSGDCSTGLFSNLTGENARAVCIGTGSTLSSSALATATPTTSETGASTIATSTSASVTASITAQPGIIDTCDKLHEVVSGDTCDAICQTYDITLATFYEWNPQLDDACTAIWLGYGVCVGVSS